MSSKHFNLTFLFNFNNVWFQLENNYWKINGGRDIYDEPVSRIAGVLIYIFGIDSWLFFESNRIFDICKHHYLDSI